jgi:type IV pilus secretin PilQ/predicted competence protein
MITRRVCLLAALATLLSAEGMRAVELNRLNDISVNGNVVTLTFERNPRFDKYLFDSPYRLVVDIKDCVKATTKDAIVPKQDDVLVSRVRSSQFSERPDKVARVVVDLKKNVPFDVVAKDNVVKITLGGDAKGGNEIVPDPVLEEVSPEAMPPTKPVDVVPVGKAGLPTVRIASLEFDKAEIGDVLQMLAVKANTNIIYGPDVTGTISLSLRNVPFNKAFETIMKLHGLTYSVLSSNIIRVGKPQTFELERSNAVIFTKIFPLNYALSDDVKVQLDAIRQAEGRTKGLVTADKRTNSLIISESEDGLKYIEEWIRRLDTKPYQVSIEAKIVDISLDDLGELGVNWGVQTRTLGTDAGSPLSYLPGVGIPGTNVSITQTAPYAGSALTMMEAESLMGVPGAAQFRFGFLTESMMVGAQIGALVTQGKANVLSSPRVTTMSNKTASIVAGQSIPYKVVTQQPGGGPTQESYAFLDAGVRLTVTPIVSPDKWITLVVQPNVSIPGAASGAGVPPPVKTRTTDVTVMVRNNETLVIGGLISDSDLETIRKIPLIGDIPLLGALFKYRSTSKTKSELVILITPRIIED